MINKNPISVQHGTFVAGELIGNNFIVESILAVGSNCIVLSAKPKGQPQAASVAIKISEEKVGRTALATETTILQSVKINKHFARIIESGHHKQFNYIVTQLLGSNLRDLALHHPTSTFSLRTLLKFAYQAVEAIQSLHQVGFVHGSVNAEIHNKP
ncbi:MAG: hypothetical protein EZS28_016679 [Streblomastix strix]|uniref:Protein kinase domain-containing protein n=1 Tax=Streblomastix strix TaxID=222440 RepID=A0A5J4VYQ0_9EUKA|nr:MAG: hypothetical protein EZS28_016679 [Streblomastix strix]